MKLIKYKSINENVYTMTLPNRMKVYYIKKSGFNKKMALISVDIGSVDSSSKINLNGKYVKLNDGIAHFLEHRMFSIKGKEASDLFAKNGADSNAFTSHDQTVYHFECSENFYDNLAILLEMLDSFDSSKKQVENEKSIIIQELKMYKDEKYPTLIGNLYKQAYDNHPISVDIGGSEKSVTDTTYDMLKSVFEAFYNPRNMMLVISGDLDENELERFLLENQLKDKKIHKIRKNKFFLQDAVFSESTIIDFDVSIPLLGMLIKLPNEKWIKTRKSQFILNMVLEYLFSLSSKFTEKLLLDNKISESVGYEAAVNVDLPRILLYNETENYDELMDEISKLFSRDLDITEDDFVRIKNSFCGRILRSYDDVSNIALEFLSAKKLDIDMFEDIKIIENIEFSDVFKMFDVISKASRTSCVMRRKEK